MANGGTLLVVNSLRGNTADTCIVCMITEEASWI